MEVAAETAAQAIVTPADLSGGVRARILLYLGGLVLLIGFGTPYIGLIDIPIAFFLKNKLHLSFNFLGPQRLKNIDAEVPAYSAVMLGAPAPAVHVRADPAPPAPRTRNTLVVSAIRSGAIIAFLGAINLFSWSGHFWFQWPSLAVLLGFAIRASRLYQHGEEK